MMNESLPVFERSWKRPNLVPNYAKVWDRFTKEGENGQIYNIRIQDVTPDLYEEVWDMYKHHFYTDEELVKSANVIEDEITMVSQKWSSYQCLKENLSLVAVLDQQSSKPIIVGGLLLAVKSKDDPPDPELPGKARARVRGLYKILQRNSDPFEKLKIDHHFVDYGLVVKSEYRRLGIATELLRAIKKMAEELKITAIVTTFNNIASQKLAARLGYTVLNEVQLSDYVNEEGQKILHTVKTKVVQQCYYRFLEN